MLLPLSLVIIRVYAYVQTLAAATEQDIQQQNLKFEINRAQELLESKQLGAKYQKSAHFF